MPRSTILLARGATSREAFAALFRELEGLLPEQDPGSVLVLQARAESDGSGYVAEASFWRLAKRTLEED